MLLHPRRAKSCSSKRSIGSWWRSMASSAYVYVHHQHASELGRVLCGRRRVSPLHQAGRVGAAFRQCRPRGDRRSLMLLACLVALWLRNAMQAFQILLWAGTGLIFLLRWYWWRINARGEIASSRRRGSRQMDSMHGSPSFPAITSPQACSRCFTPMVSILTRPASSSGKATRYLTRVAAMKVLTDLAKACVRSASRSTTWTKPWSRARPAIVRPQDSCSVSPLWARPGISALTTSTLLRTKLA